MFLMSLIGLGLIAGFLIFDSSDDTDSAVEEDEMDSNTDGQEPPVMPIDQLLGTIGDDTLSGAEGDNTLLGRNGNDALSGRGGMDRVFGDGGMDTVTGGDGNDSVFGGNGNDFVSGGTGDDYIRGGRDHDILIDSLGADTLHGDLGQDLIVSSGLLSAAASEALVADPDPENGVQDLLQQLEIDLSVDQDASGDLADGGEGDDTMIFGVDDTVTGGSGKDTFVTSYWLEGQPPATITDFELGEDQLVYVFDPDAGNEPEMTVQNVANSSGGSDAILFANGTEVLRIENQDGQFDPAIDIRLIPQRTGLVA